ncbi:MAG: mRNA surveillance protein pelota [Nanoarchaeota archaeon]|nr:mRNA surveillance protein pelota [Nanoarchaeota archaeon]
MDIITSQFKKGIVRLKITDADDLWYLSHLIEPNDLLRGTATRKIKISDSGEKTQLSKRTLTLTIKAETIELDDSGKILRINGRIKEGPDDIPKDSYQAIALEEGNEFTLEKTQWLQYQQQKLLEAAEKKYSQLFCLFDREEAIFALSKKFGHEILTKLQGEVHKKRLKTTVKQDFYQEIIAAVDSYNQRYNPDHIILASPAFYKEDLFQKISSPEIKKKIVLTSCSDISESSLSEVMRKPELAAVLKTSRSREEQLLMEELLAEINKEGKAAYGWKEVQQAIDAGAVTILIISDQFIRQKKMDGSYQELDEKMKQVDAAKGKITILSSEFDSGKKLNGLGGIAALLRYKLEWI